jgi:DNA-directed RNA polymerase subunit H (RpoH/RPB5)
MAHEYSTYTTIFKNISMMFYQRKCYGESQIETISQELLTNLDESLETSTEFFILKIIPDKIKKKDVIEEFVSRPSNCPKLLLISSIFPKVSSFLSTVDVEIFTIHEMILNPMAHKYSPKKVTVLSEDECKKFLDDMQISFFSLPQIKISDPLARYYKLKLDNIIEIERNSPACGTSLYYRRVVVN